MIEGSMQTRWRSPRVIRREDQKSKVQRSDRTGASRGRKMHDRGENRAITFPDMFRSKDPSGMRLLIPHSTRVEHYRTRGCRSPGTHLVLPQLHLEKGLDAVVLLFPEGPHMQEPN
jgi:hypothetical protein